MNHPRQVRNHEGFSGVFVPRLILEDARLSAPARILFGCLDGLGKQEQGCFASSAYLSKVVGVKPRHIRNLLAQLERLGYITRSKNLAGWRIIKTATTIALEGCSGAAPQCRGGRHHSATYRIEDRDNKPHSPLKRGNRVKKVKLKGDDYAQGF